MADLRSDKVKQICDDNYTACCQCPIYRPCQMKAGDTRESWAERMNAAAEETEE